MEKITDHSGGTLSGGPTRRGFLAAGGLTVVGAMVAGCSSTPSQQGSAAGSRTAKPSGTITIAQPDNPITLDGSLNSTITDRNIYLALYDTLFDWDFSGSAHQMVPSLATRLTSTGPATWRMTLRDGVKWHNGDPFTAEDVQFTITRVLDPANHSSQASFYSGIKSVQVIDQHTVEIVTDGGEATLPVRLTLFPMVPKRYLQQVGSAGFASHPVGTGPYVFKSFVPNDKLTLTANPNYWGSRPAYETAVYGIIPDTASRTSALQSGGVNFAVNLSPDSIQTVSSTAGLRATSLNVDRVMIIYIDTVHGGPLADQRVRQALNYAVNKQGIIESLLAGKGVPVASTVPPGFLGYDTSVRPYSYDPALARQLLSQAGYAKGFSLTLRHTNGYYPSDTLVAQAIGQNLEAVGISVKDVGSEASTYFSDFLAQSQKKTSSPYIFLGSWGAPVFDIGIQWQDAFSTGNPVQLWENTQFSSYVDQGLATLDSNARQQLYFKAFKIMYDQAPAVFLYQIADSWGMVDQVSWTPRPDELAVPQEMRIA